MGQSDLSPVETFPVGMEVSSAEFRAKLNVTAAWAHAISKLRVEGAPFSVGVGGITIGHQQESGGGEAVEVVEMQVQSEQNDYLVCQEVDDDGEPDGTDVNVAKPRLLRHEAKWRENVSTITTVKVDEVDVTFNDETDDETWAVTESYVSANGLADGKEPTSILASLVRMASEVSVSDTPLQWMDLNYPACRVMAVVP